MRGFDRRLIVGAAVAAVVLAAGSTLAMAAGSTTPGTATPTTPAVSCAAPSLPGAVVDVTLTDMGARMRGAATSGGSGMGGQMRGMPAR